MTTCALPAEELVAAMLDPGTYPHGPAGVEIRETHISWVFLAGDLVYKVKKALVLPFLDYGSPKRRHLLCREEVRLNRRLAPDIYRGVVGLAVRDGGVRVVEEGDPGAIEFAVEMNRIDERRSIAALAGRSQFGLREAERVGERLARFHAAVPELHGAAAGVDAQLAPIEANLATLEGLVRSPGDAEALTAGRIFVRGFAEDHRAELEERSGSGRVRDGHGDLRAEHVIVPSEGEVYAFDCVEFDSALREFDVAQDLAFLVMDLTRIGHARHLPALLSAYRRAGGAPGGERLLAFFAAHRAWVRATVSFLRELELPPGASERPLLRDEAEGLFRLGRRFAWRAREPAVLVVCGVAASGKTTLAGELSELSGWTRLSSDETRKRLAGIAPTARGPESIYAPEFTRRTYHQLGVAAAGELERGRGAVVDATFHRRADRDAFRRGLGGSSQRVLFAECRAAEEVLLRRAEERLRRGGSASDAGPDIVRRQLNELDPMCEVPGALRTTLARAASSAELAGEAEAFVSTAQAGRSGSSWGGASSA